MCGPDLTRAQLVFIGSVQKNVVGHDEVSIVTEPDVARVHTLRVQLINFRQKDLGVDHNAVADDRDNPGMKYT